MQRKYTKPECNIFILNSGKIVNASLSGGYGSNVGEDGEAGGSIGSDDIINGGSF